jgi:hypothetical protein
MNYEQLTINYANKNKANSKPIKANTNPKQTQSNPIFTKNPEKLARLVRKLAPIPSSKQTFLIVSFLQKECKIKGTVRISG